MSRPPRRGAAQPGSQSADASAFGKATHSRAALTTEPASPLTGQTRRLAQPRAAADVAFWSCLIPRGRDAAATGRKPMGTDLRSVDHGPGPGELVAGCCTR